MKAIFAYDLYVICMQLAYVWLGSEVLGNFNLKMSFKVPLLAFLSRALQSGCLVTSEHHSDAKPTSKGVATASLTQTPLLVL